MKTKSKSKNIFPLDLPEREWVEFQAEGYGEPVCGVLYTSDRPPSCGMPLGGIGTGCIDLEADGTFGYSTLFNSLLFPRPGTSLPFLGVSAGGRTWLLTTTRRASLEGNGFARRIRYWGHYPIADLEYELDAPIGIGVRAWAPFIPGDTEASNIPAAVFEVHLRNGSGRIQRGTVAFSFPGLARYERDYGGPLAVNGTKVSGELTGYAVLSPPAHAGYGTKRDYVLGVIGEEGVRIGGGLGGDGGEWAKIERELPIMAFRSDERDDAVTVAVDYELGSRQTKVIRFVLAWYVREWYGTGLPFDHTYTGFTDSSDMNLEQGANKYSNRYAERFKDGLEVARFIAQEHGSLLPRILSWQQAIYSYPGYPIWLKDSLINILHLIAETSRWASAKPPVGEWAAPDGIFAMNESPRDCPCMDAQASAWYGHWPIVLFFPRLACTTVRAYKQFTRPDGQPPFKLGSDFELVKPTQYDYQTEQNGTVYASSVCRIWQYTGEDALLEEFYESVKKTAAFTAGLNSGPYGLVAVSGPNFFEVPWPGIVTYVAGMRLAGIRIAQHMAERKGDAVFAEQCRQWIARGSRIVEEKMWDGSHYLLYYTTQDCIREMEKNYEKNYGIPGLLKNLKVSGSPANGPGSAPAEIRCDYIMANQLNGEWIAHFHGLPGVFDAERVKITLETLKKTVVSYADSGVINILRPDRTPVEDMYRANSYTLAELYILAMTYMYQGDMDTGLEITHKCLNNLVCKQGYTWNVPATINVSTGTVDFGTDYYQSLMLWAVPLAMKRGTAAQASEPGWIVDRVLQAGRAF